MGKANFTDEFKLDAIKQITERGYSVADVSHRLGVSTHSLYSWMKRYNAPGKAAAQDDQLSEIRRLKQELARVTELRDWPSWQVSKPRLAISATPVNMVVNPLSS